MKNWNLLVFGASFILVLTQCLPLQLVSAAGSSSTAKKSKPSHRNRYSLVPPPPPVPVSPTVLAAYGRHMGPTMSFIPSRPRHLAEEMRLTAVVDDVAFFKLHQVEEGIHLKQGNSYSNSNQTVTVAQIGPEAVVLEEKGQQYVKRLQ